MEPGTAFRATLAPVSGRPANRSRFAIDEGMACSSKRAAPRKGRDGLDNVLFVRADQHLLDKLNQLLERRQRENPGPALSRAGVARAILRDAVTREGLTGS